MLGKLGAVPGPDTVPAQTALVAGLLVRLADPLSG